MPAGTVLSRRSISLVEIRTRPVARSPTFFLPVAVNSTLISCFCSCLRALTVFFSVSVVASVPSETSSSTVTVVVFAVIITVARGANQIAHMRNPMRSSAPPPINTNFLRNTLKFGTAFFFALAFLSASVTLISFSAITALTAAAPAEVGFLVLFCSSPTGRSRPSMISSPSSTLSAGISAISGLLWRFFATGICADAASPASA